MTTEMKNIGAAGDVLVERRGNAGLITLNRPKALNALSLPMVRELLGILRAWRDDPEVLVVAIRGTNKVGRPGTPDSLFGGFCAGGDIRFFHQAALAGDAALDDFFTEEYTLNHLIHTYPKPYIAFMDGVVMGGGMGISQGAQRAHRHRAHQDGHARDQHRPVSRRGRRLLPEPLPRPRGRIPGADRARRLAPTRPLATGWPMSGWTRPPCLRSGRSWAPRLGVRRPRLTNGLLLNS